MPETSELEVTIPKLYTILVEATDEGGNAFAAWTIISESFVNDPLTMADDLPYILYDLKEQISEYVDDPSRWSWRAAETQTDLFTSGYGYIDYEDH